MHGPHIYYAWGLYLPVSVNVMLEGFTSQIQISWMYYNCFVYIVREGIKGVLGVRQPCTKEKDFMLMAQSALCGSEWCY